MSDGKTNLEQTYVNLKRELEVIGKAHDFLHMGRFAGNAAMDLATCQAYLKALYNHMAEELKKMAPLELPKEEVKPVVAQAEALPELPTDVAKA